MQIQWEDSRLGLRNSTTRIPFRYGKACLTRCPQALLQVQLVVDGRPAWGLSGDCLPPSWFDKSPDKNYAEQIDDMIAVVRLAEKCLADELRSPQPFFAAWLVAYERIHSQARLWQVTPLLASFGLSMVERAVIDAMARAAGLSLHQAVRQNLFAIEPGAIHDALADFLPGDWLPDEPSPSIFVRHTVGLGDPLTASDLGGEPPLDDGLPQTLEQYVQRSGLRYFKLKVANRADQDLERLRVIAELVERVRGRDYRVTLDGNEQFASMDEFAALVEAIQSDPALQSLWSNTLLIEQPLRRDLALHDDVAGQLQRSATGKPVIIDESDGTLDDYPRALNLGYRGVSSKNCKGAIKSWLNHGLTWLRNGRSPAGDYGMTAEDLCTVGIVPVQSDLCLAASLGIAHVERNGHHFHPGLSYLPAAQQQAALAAHHDLYTQQGPFVAANLVDGRFQIGSLQCSGYGFAVEIDLDAYQPADQWQFASLGLDDE